MAIDPEAVLAQLTLEQKVALLAGADMWHTVEVPGVPPLRCSDGPAGVRGTSWNGPPSASFPCGTALGATFDPPLIEEVGRALGREARSKGAHVVLAPTVNLHRTPIGGRNFECMSEDPLLTARLAVAYIVGMQSERVGACIKHFVANDTEFERMTISSEVDERTLRELYLVPFEVAVRPLSEGGADVRSLMSSYNRVNGTYASEHRPLLREVLRDEWGFDGVVFSDWYGTHSAEPSLEASLDLEMPGPARHRDATLADAIRSGGVDEALVDEAVGRLLRLMAWCGVGDSDSADETTDDSPATREVIRRTAVAATVLLKNERSVLPIARDATVALIGPNSARGQVQGGGSARVRANRPVAILAAMRNRGIDVTHEEGCSIAKRLPSLRGSFEATYTSRDGTVAVVPVDRLQLVFLDPPAPDIDHRAFGVTVTGTFVPDTTGDWEFGLVAVGPATLHVNGELVCDLSEPQSGGTFFGRSSPEVRGTAPLEAGVPATVVLTHPYLEDELPRALMVGAAAPDVRDGVDRAAEVAAAADVAVVVVGTNDDWETEGEDRADMELPGRQDELIARVAAANPNTIVVINAGSPVTMPWLDAVPAVMQVWFPGEEIGNSIADVLVGDAEPGGRLPTTIPKALIDTPAAISHPGKNGLAPYDEGVLIGYRWYDARQIEPQFPFGHGLGYTTWELTGASVTGSIAGGVSVRVDVTNSGDRA
ncbi:MAG: glycoside hydrolase family 3 C-terminal domain-containing protein, partial [Actinobacteria bacterium]|nr:glycoside hydrolase family 3 C-terminal domain-containing protein [Actinomycetota bacterium]